MEIENRTTVIEEQSKSEVAQNEDLMISEPKNQPHNITMWNDTKLFTTTYKMAKIVAASDIVPQAYRGKEGNCLIAIDMANRMGISPAAVMQNSQVINNNFSWKGSACKSLVDGCGKYKSSRYVEVGERGKDNWGYYLEAITKNGDIVKGITVTIATAKAEGWYERNPKWKSLTELMLKYRCASFFAKTECPSVLMGFQTTEELQDVYGYENDKQTVTIELNKEQ